MDELVARVSQASGLDPAEAQQAVAAILGFLRKEGPSDQVDQLFAAIPGADAAAASADDGAGEGGLGGLMAMTGGSGLMALAGKLSGLGLSMGDMQSVGRELFAFARDNAGEEVVGQIAGAVPGLSQFI